MSLSDDVDDLLLAVFEREQERQRKGEPQRPFESADLAAALGWAPERFNRAAAILEKRGLVEVDPSLGSAPYDTHGMFLTAEGWLACGKLGGRPQPAQPAATMPSPMPRDPAQQHALDVVADYLEATAVWIEGRALRSKMKGSVEEKNTIIDKLVPALLVREGEYPSDRYRLTLEGALESRHAHAIRQYLGDVLDILKAKAKRNKTFEEFSLDDIKAGDSDIAEAFEEKSFKWLHRVMRIAGICNDNSPDGGPWGVPTDIEEVLECKNVEELRALRRQVRSVVPSSRPSPQWSAAPFTPHQQQVVDAVTENWFTQPAWIKGRVLRALLKEVAPDERDREIQSLVPRYLQRSHQAQDDVYGPTLEGALGSSKREVLRLYLGAVHAIFRKKYAVEPGFDDYAWL